MKEKGDTLAEALKGFEAMRKKIKKPLTDRAKKMLLKRLQLLSNDEETQIKILNQSEFYCWQNVYHLTPGYSCSGGKVTLDSSMDRLKDMRFK